MPHVATVSSYQFFPMDWDYPLVSTKEQRNSLRDGMASNLDHCLQNMFASGMMKPAVQVPFLSS
jgi:hypothetical protein